MPTDADQRLAQSAGDRRREPLTKNAVTDLAALAHAGRYHHMEAKARALTRSHPSSGLAWKALGFALQMQGKEALPALERSARLLPDDAEAQSNLGAALRQSGRLDEAVACLRRVLKVRPDIAELWNNLGNAERDLGQADAAVVSLGEALQLKPGFAKAHNNMGNALLDLGRIDEAAASYERALECDANYAEAHINFGAVQRLMGRTAQAQFHAERALAIDPKCPGAITLLAHLRSDRGEFAEARALFRRAISIDPNCAEAWAALAGLGRMSSDDADWLVGAERAAERTSPRNEIPLRFAIGKCLDDNGDYENAFKNYRRANDLAKSHHPRHDQHLLTAGIDRLVQSQNAEWLARTVSSTIGSERAVFIVGMPRSGTTLAEQILASHPQVYGAGELPYWNGAAGRYATRVPEHADQVSARQLADEYLTLLGELSNDASRVVDKMPANFMFLGLIHAALPLARIIHLERNPIDTCLSIYFQNFGSAHSYASDLNDLAHYYKEYRRIMTHWRQILPRGVILDVPYEELVENPEHWSRAMIEFIGLPWDARCRDFHGTKRIVSTFSRWQARQPINARSVGRSRHYEKFVGPLRSLI